ncbi:MAG: peptidoglycan-binding domain-containing protein [Planctomycetota bacterium]
MTGSSKPARSAPVGGYTSAGGDPMRRIATLVCALVLLAAPAALAITSQQGWTLRRLTNREVTPDISAHAVRILRAHRSDPYGTDVPFVSAGEDFVGRIEQHYHPPGGAMKPWGYHPGVSVFAVMSKNGALPTPPQADALDPVRQGRLLLRRGSRGGVVAELQRQLTSAGYALVPDGIFGRRTDAAVRRFQTDAAIKVDGVVGRQTVAALDRATTSPSP